MWGCVPNRRLPFRSTVHCDRAPHARCTKCRPRTLPPDKTAPFGRNVSAVNQTHPTTLMPHNKHHRLLLSDNSVCTCTRTHTRTVMLHYNLRRSLHFATNMLFVEGVECPIDPLHFWTTVSAQVVNRFVAYLHLKSLVFGAEVCDLEHTCSWGVSVQLLVGFVFTSELYCCSSAH